MPAAWNNHFFYTSKSVADSHRDSQDYSTDAIEAKTTERKEWQDENRLAGIPQTATRSVGGFGGNDASRSWGSVIRVSVETTTVAASVDNINNNRTPDMNRLYRDEDDDGCYRRGGRRSIELLVLVDHGGVCSTATGICRFIFENAERENTHIYVPTG